MLGVTPQLRVHRYVSKGQDEISLKIDAINGAVAVTRHYW
jgi:hypothetical protein